MPRLGAPTLTSDGRYGVYSVVRTDPETFERYREHYLIDLQKRDHEPVKIDLPITGFSHTFGPDNFLYFLSYESTDEDAATQSRLWRVALEASGNVTGPMLVADIAGTDILGFAIAPGADKIALWSEIARDCPRFGCAPEDRPLGSGRLYDGAAGFYRHWDRWVEPGTLSRVFVFGMEDGQTVGDGFAVDGGSTLGAIAGNTPTMPFGGAEDVVWSADGDGLFFVARAADGNEPSSTDHDIYFSDLSGAPEVLTAENLAVDTAPTPSPDGRLLAYLAMARPGYESDRLVIHLRDLRTGAITALTQDIDLSFGSLAWSRDSKFIYATAPRVLDTPVFRIDTASGEMTELDLIEGNEAHIANVMPLADGSLLFTRDSIETPNELYLGGVDTSAQRISDIAINQTSALAPVETRRFSFAGANGDTVWGQITKLKGSDEPLPGILYIHGGPQGSFADRWSSRWNPRVLASQGYSVISIDFHGSAGYGEDFMDSINRDWGGKPLEDLQKGLAAALSLDDQIDGSRVCAMGASYGGYMVNWIAGNWPDRFDCLVQHDGLFDLRSFYYSTEELWFPKWDFGGSYAEARETYERWNPVNHVEQWRTPMLVIAGERDFRVPYTQGLQSFTALQERGIPSQLLVFPDENHWVLGAENSLQWHDTVFDWLERWLKDDQSEGAGE